MFYHGIRLSPDGPTDLGPGVGYAFAYGANASGAVAGECGETARHACRWDGTWEELGPGLGLDVALDGTVVGADAAGATLWDPVGEVEALPGDRALAVSPSGRWVAGTGASAWLVDRDSGTTAWLPDLDGDDGRAGRVEPLDVDDQGVVVGEAAGPGGERRAFRYAPGDAALTALEAVTDETGLRLVSARAVDAGRIVVDAIDGDGTPWGVLLTPE
ncbi:hypothetical protein L6R50_10655 [Myxococcota bacterium]|nr:hypothetical protein [Myxococcota bacterium]